MISDFISESLATHTANEKAEGGRWNSHTEDFLPGLYQVSIM